MSDQNQQNLNHYKLQGALPPAMASLIPTMLFTLTGEEPSADDISQVTNASEILFVIMQEHGLAIGIALALGIVAWGWMNGGKGKTSSSPEDLAEIKALNSKIGDMGQNFAELAKENLTVIKERDHLKRAHHDQGVKIQALENVIETLKPT